TGEPVEGVLVSVVGTKVSTHTVVDGMFSFADLKEGAFRFAFSHADYLPDTSEEVSLVRGVAHRMDIELQPAKSIEEETGIVWGSITDSATQDPLAHATVSLLNTNHSALSDSAGSFALAHVPPGTYSLLATKWGYETKVTSGLVIRAKEETQVDIAIVPREVGMLSAGGTVGAVEGVVVDDEGEPFEGAMVLVKETGDWTSADHVGRFRMDSIAGGVYTVIAAAEGFDTVVNQDVDVWNGEVTSLTLQLKKESAADGELSVHPDKAAITGIVVDSEKQSPLAGVAVGVIDSDVKAVTDPSGRYVLEDLAPGRYTLRFLLSGYDDRILEGIEAPQGKATHADAVLRPSGVTEMDRATVRAASVQSTTAALLKERSQAISFTDAIGSQEISRTGASNAADAMKSVTGASVVGGKYVLIRGLPERYTITMLNGSPIPSPDPDRKAVNMDLFPAGMIENIKVNKTFTPDLPGNFAGGVVDIRTRPFPEKFTLNASASGGIDWQTHTANGLHRNRGFLSAEDGSLDWLGFDDGSRELPEIYEDYTKVQIDEYAVWYQTPIQFYQNRLQDPQDGLADTINALDKMAKALDTNMTFHRQAAPVNQSYAFSMGNTFRPGDRPLGILAGVSYSNGYGLSEDNAYRDYQFVKDAPTPQIDNDFKRTKSENTVLWGGVATAAFKITDEQVVKLDYIRTQNAIDGVEYVTGAYTYYYSRDDDAPYETRVIYYIQRAVNHLQPSGKHEIWIGDQPFHLAWRGAYTTNTQSEPDRREVPFFTKPSFPPGTFEYPIPGDFDKPTHQWRELEDRAGSAELSLAIPFYQWSGDSATATVGGSWYGKRRERSQREIHMDWEDFRTSNENRYTYPIDLITRENAGLLEDSTWGMIIVDESDDRAQTQGFLDIISAFGMVQIPLFGPFSTTVGLRYERADMFVATTVAEEKESTIGTLDDHDFLPSASVNYALKENMNLRAAYGRTLVRPSMREKSPYQEKAFAGGPSYLGNEELKRSKIDNADLRWEWFMKPGELLAASGFFKAIHDPIELRFWGNDVRTPVNTPSDALIAGAEFEARKQMDFVPALRYFQVAGNLTLAWSRVKLDSTMQKYDIFEDAGEDTRPFQNQSPYVVNIFLTFDHPDAGTNFNVTYNVFGTRLAELTDQDKKDFWQKPEHSLSVTAGQKLGSRLKLSVKAKNLIGADERYFFKYKAKEYTVRETKKGPSFSLGLSYGF
ncbi:MAG: outer membrane beta-barrel protein, partial [Chitinivibrionales bacterium]|nr:outer membrane beta-barrel protein [Chitinivibrionales bacterium]MBD3395859.1 outer membrane beta-barrel protein [Chitinivibrionales bacterium]